MATMLEVRRMEPTSNYSPARARWATGRIETEGTVYVGRIYVPRRRSASPT